MKFNSELPKQHALRTHIEEWGIFYVLLIIFLVVLGFWASHHLGSEELPPGHITVAVSKQHYKVGEKIEFTVQNNFDVPVYVSNSCPTEPLNVYKWDGEQWQRIHDKTDVKNCADQKRQITIEPHTNKTYDYSDWPNLFKEPGQYRIAVEIEHYEAYPFQDFEVMAPPKVEIKRVPAPATSDDSSNTTPSTSKSRETEQEQEHETEVENEIE